MAKDKLSSAQHAALWDDFRGGDPAAFSSIYELFASELYRYGYNLVRNKQLVEDCLHELFLHLHAQRAGLGATDNIRFYLFRAMRRRLTDNVTRLNKFESDDYIFERAEFLIQPYETDWIDEQAIARQKMIVLNELNRLPKRQKEILYLVFMKGLSYQEASEVMKITIKTVYNSIHVALTTLKSYLQESLKKEGIIYGVAGWFLNYFINN